MKKSLKALRKEMQMLEAGKRKVDERKILEKKIKALKFRKTKFGKFGLAVTSVGAKLTRPAQRTKEGKVIEGTGGVGAKLMGMMKGSGKAPVRKQMYQQSPMQTAFASPMEYGVPMKRKKKKKPFNINAVLQGMPE